jgi:hypothetical protein
MNRYRQRHSDYKPAKAPRDDDSGSTDADLSKSASSVFSEAEEHRKRVIAKDLAAKARKKGARRG